MIGNLLYYFTMIQCTVSDIEGSLVRSNIHYYSNNDRHSTTYYLWQWQTIDEDVVWFHVSVNYQDLVEVR